ncbi:unnamed protein product [Victoria cruziana]
MDGLNDLGLWSKLSG